MLFCPAFGAYSANETGGFFPNPQKSLPLNAANRSCYPAMALIRGLTPKIAIIRFKL